MISLDINFYDTVRQGTKRIYEKTPMDGGEQIVRSDARRRLKSKFICGLLIGPMLALWSCYEFVSKEQGQEKREHLSKLPA